MEAGASTAVNTLIVLLSAIELSLTSSVYDFIVTHELFYAYPKKILLISAAAGRIQYAAASLSFILSLASIVYCAYRFQTIANQFLTVAHRATLFVCAVLHVISCSISYQASLRVALFNTADEIDDFIEAAQWYTLRLRLSMAAFASTSILSLFVFFIKIDSDLRRQFANMDRFMPFSK